MSVLNNRLSLHRTRSFLVTDLGARWHRHIGAQAQQEVSVAAGVKNVFDQRQKDLEVGALRDSDYVYGPRFARVLVRQPALCVLSCIALLLACACCWPHRRWLRTCAQVRPR
jgi:hypothetical protein